MSDKIHTLTDKNWDEEVLQAKEPVLVDFWAEWCMPCKTLAPIIEVVAAHYGDKLKVGKLNVDENTDIPYRYSITALPTLMVFRNGQVSEQRIGLISKENLIKLLDPLVGSMVS